MSGVADDLRFEVHVLRFYRRLRARERRFLSENATEVRKLGLWLFEGDYDVFRDDELEGATHLGTIVVPALGDLDDEALAKLVADRMEANP